MFCETRDEAIFIARLVKYIGVKYMDFSTHLSGLIKDNSVSLPPTPVVDFK